MEFKDALIMRFANTRIWQQQLLLQLLGALTHPHLWDLLWLLHLLRCVGLRVIFSGFLRQSKSHNGMIWHFQAHRREYDGLQTTMSS